MYFNCEMKATWYNRYHRPEALDYPGLTVRTRCSGP